ncbi:MULTISPECIES: TIGR02922 family protein [Gammaproteobacteria]|uniref:TIGR02922 family protein n=1 Tax=Gammaproteobacteria TaxID=1236 RepID=UPI000849BC91|nr:TIGR02922 family protein [Shewanella xiamenensis]MCT8865392.1 TIGR02922 family protein [Shewanella xiamenensis]MCT8869330.1 TIGR02922 family protein [Shewanella xiamenensis]MCT8873827.1 TIGR02922 family protein [Shewanella xiamenensis]MCT8877487.1 TIGR02922 family protein [Shewanella xiamenensis]ODR83716.1 hypothetical protein ABT47_23395 [Shewanella xiamenensis]
MLKSLDITILYYDEEFSLVLKSECLSGCKISDSGRVIIPANAKEGKLIVAVLEGSVRVLNALGDRALPAQQVA